MSKERPDIKTVFSKALEKKSLIERNAYLQEACGKDNKLRAEVEELLKANDAAGSFLDKPAAGLDNTQDMSKVEKPGTVIGRYKLLQLIGEGGFGMVYMAEQAEPIRRRVALKIIKLGMDTKQVIARFEAERQALALMDHPNIAKVLDAGATETGRPYFVMELVKGVPITDYCDSNNLSTLERLKLFIDVCKAVQHAHQKGIIHRDIKPSNVMITLHDGVPVPKVIDFGVAKATQQRLTEKTLFTEFRQFIGTPEYMSPEQAEMSGLDVDTRTDIYSLGVLLYELLAGTTPFEANKLRKATFEEMRKIIRETEPLKPSTRLYTLGDALTDVAKHRQVQPDQLCKLIRGDLDWVVMKTLEKDRTRRYETANELAMDIKRHLVDEPVVAGPPSRIYKLEKFVRRHAGSVVTATLVVVAIILGLVVSSAMYFRAEKALQKEAVARGVAEEARSAEAKQRQLAEERGEEYRHLSYVHGVALADAKYREQNLSSAQTLLESCPPDLRGWEWYRLDRILDEASITFDTGSGFLWSIAISPDGERIASGDMDGIVTVWDATSGAKKMIFKKHAAPTGSMVFSPDGKHLVSGSFDGTVVVWDTSSGDEVMTLKHGEQIVSVLYSLDGKRIISIARYKNKTIKVWDATSGKEMTTIECGEQRSDSVESVALSPDGKQLITGQYDGKLKLWDVETGKELKTLHGHERGIFSVSFSPDGTQIVLGSFDGTVKILNAVTGEEGSSLKGHERGGAVVSVSFSPDGKRVVSGSFDHTIKVWDSATGDELATLIGHHRKLSDVVFSPDGKRIISSSFSGKIKVWDSYTRKDLTMLQEPKGGFKDSVGRIDFSPDGRCMASASSDNTIKLWNMAGTKEIRILKGHEHTINCLDFSPDGKRIISGSEDNTIKVWDASTGNELMTLHGHKGRVSSVAFSPDGQQIVSGSRDKTIKIWDVTTGDELMTFLKQAKQVLYVAFSPDGKRIVSCIGEKIKVWDTSTGNELAILSGHEGFVLSVAFSPDGKRIVSGSYDATIRLWDAATGDEVMRLLGHNDKVVPVAFSPDGRRIVSGSHDCTTKVWDATTGFEMMTLVVDSGSEVQSTVFSPDGKTLATACSDGSIILW